MTRNNSELLKNIMSERDLKPVDVARIIGCSVWTVYQWRSGYDMPDRQMELFKLKLAVMDKGVLA